MSVSASWNAGLTVTQCLIITDNSLQSLKPINRQRSESVIASLQLQNINSTMQLLRPAYGRVHYTLLRSVRPSVRLSGHFPSFSRLVEKHLPVAAGDSHAVCALRTVQPPLTEGGISFRRHPGDISLSGGASVVSLYETSLHGWPAPLSDGCDGCSGWWRAVASVTQVMRPPRHPAPATGRAIGPVCVSVCLLQRQVTMRQ